MSRKTGLVKPLAIALLLLLPIAFGLYRVSSADYDVERIAPNTAFRVHTTVLFESDSDSLRLRVRLPRNEPYLALGTRFSDTDLLNFTEYKQAGNRVAEWWGEIEDRGKLVTAFTVIARKVAYSVDPHFVVPGRPTDPGPFLAATESVQADHPSIRTLANNLAPTGTLAEDGLRSILRYCAELETASDTSSLPVELGSWLTGRPGTAEASSFADQPEAFVMSPPPYVRADDAVTTLESGRATSLGRAHLFAALARHCGLPTRLVHGLGLEAGFDQEVLTWAEVRLGTEWIPFCPTDNLFAELDGRRVPFCRGDVPIVQAFPAADLHYRFDVERTFAVRGKLVEGSNKADLGWLGLWGRLEEAGISMDVQRIILMIPFGALVSVFTRNILGLRTFGFFLPLLIAIAAMRSGIGWGIAAFLGVIGTNFIVRSLVDRLKLLHFPQLAILLTTAVVAVMVLAAIGAIFGNINLAHVTFLPFAVLTIVTEKFSVVLEEEGPGEVMRVTFMSVIAIILSFFVMSNWALQTLVLSFPETFFILIVVDILIGSWTGMRLMEYWRFRRLIRVGEEVPQNA